MITRKSWLAFCRARNQSPGCRSSTRLVNLRSWTQAFKYSLAWRRFQGSGWLKQKPCTSHSGWKNYGVTVRFLCCLKKKNMNNSSKKKNTVALSSVCQGYLSSSKPSSCQEARRKLTESALQAAFLHGQRVFLKSRVPWLQRTTHHFQCF